MRVHALLIVLISACGTLTSAAAATFTVTTPLDFPDSSPGDGYCGDPLNPQSGCSVRAAVEESNALPGADTIYIPEAHSPYRLFLGELTLGGGQTSLLALGNEVIVDGVNQAARTDLINMASSGNLVRGLTLQRSRGHAVRIVGAGNRVDSCTIIAGGIDGPLYYAVYLEGETSHGNRITGCLVGLRADGQTLPNANGIVMLDGAHDNSIGDSDGASRNVITGNRGTGIAIIQSAHNNTVCGNYIGPDLSGTAGPGNGSDGVLVASGAYANRIGGMTVYAANLVSANHGHGIRLSGPSTEENYILGNVIGLDNTGVIALGNHGSGVAITAGASGNLVGSSDSGSTNVISGNWEHGIRVSGVGTRANVIRGNYIGSTTNGYGYIGNGNFVGAGLYCDEHSEATIVGGAGPFDGNVFSANILGGVYLDGSDDNVISGNLIGVTHGSLSSAYNGNGVVLRNGASGNLIGGTLAGERNTISGNRLDEFPFGAGVLILDPGTNDNRVVGNMIGTDRAGTRRMPNGSCGVVIGLGAQYNVVGGTDPSERNVISGNGLETNLPNLGRGVHLYGELTSFNRVAGNYIGVGADGVSPLPNLGNGVAIFDGAERNTIGGQTTAEGNLIARNRAHGLMVSGWDSRRNEFRYNRILGNDSLGIAIRQGAQQMISPPVLLGFDISGAILGTCGSAGGTIDLYLAAADPSGAGEGAAWVATGFADGSGDFAIEVPGLQPGTLLTATVTDSAGNSSAFASNQPVDLLSPVDDRPIAIPGHFSLEQNFPNPFNPTTQIRFSLPRAVPVTLDVTNILGQRVASLVDELLPAGEHLVTWDGRTDAGNAASSGVYWYRLQAGTWQAQKKMLMVK